MNFFRKQNIEMQLLDIEQKVATKSRLMWLEIRVVDLDRAINFYENVLNLQAEKNDLFGRKMALFTHVNSGFNGSLVQVPIKSTENNIRPFFKVDVMHDALKSISLFGGRIISVPELLKQKSRDGQTIIGSNLFDGEIGYVCEVEDSEGNIISLYSHS